MLKKILSFVFVIFCCTISFTQNSFTTNTMLFFDKLNSNIPQEKIYLHTDKPYYSAGETIWFKAYLLNASSHLQNTRSNFIYIELINRFDSLIQRVKIRRDSLGFAGTILLKPDIPAGKYCLRAYTYWMQNAGVDFFFTKYFEIGNTIDDRLISHISFGEIIDGMQAVKINLTDLNNKPLAAKTVELSYNGTKKHKSTTQKSNLQGEIIWKIPVDTSYIKNCYITMKIDEPSLKVKKQFSIQQNPEDFDVQFFPESGHLLQNNLQHIAFKAIGKNGLSLVVSGKIYDNLNNEIAEINSTYKGMGKVTLFTETGKSYYAIVKNERGIEKKFALPVTDKYGVSLRIIENKGKIFYDVINQLSATNTNLYLLAHSRGLLYLLKPLRATSGYIKSSSFPEGISTIAIVDSMGNVFAERLFFVNSTKKDSLIFTTNKPSFSKRELVKLNIKTNDNDTLEGDFSISITDNQLVEKQESENNIYSHLLLTSDLKGYIEGPMDFFMTDSINASEKLDLLMMTQGWRRFDLNKYLQLKAPKLNYYLEMGQSITGKVLNLINKPAKNCDINLISSYKNTFRTSKTDTLGQFLLEGIEFPDSTSLIIKAQKRKSITDVEIIPDNDVFPDIKAFIPTEVSNKTTTLNEYLNATKAKYYTEGGMRVVTLNELTVTASAKNEDSNPLYAGADTKIDANQLDKTNGMSILNYISTIPGIMVMGETISIRGNTGNPLILIDDFETESIEELQYLSTNEIQDISIFKGPSASIFGVRGGNGVIAITLKKGITIKNSPPISMAIIKPLGYQKPTSFYMPKYDVAENLNSTKADLRTTIFWSPFLKPNKNGIINIEFYTADYDHNYRVELEGINTEGDPIRAISTINRK